MEGVGGVGTLPLGSGQVCRTCLADAADALNWHETVSQHGYSATILDMLVFLGFIGNEEKEEYPDTICQSCVTKLMISYQFKLTCADASATLASLPPPQELPINFDNLTDLEIIQLDHGYDLPFPNFYPEAIDELNLDYEDDADPEQTDHIDIIPQKKKRKTKNDQYSCNLCVRTYRRHSSLRDHLATHTDARDHLCLKCGKQFHSSAGLRQHAKSHSSERPYACTSCDKRYNAKQKLNEHVRIAHTDKRFMYACWQCGKSFTAKNSLITHSKIHEGRRDYKCEDCPKTFTRAAYLREHRRNHTGEVKPKQYACSHEGCGRKFSTKYIVRQHMVCAHSQEREHQCSICPKRFATVSGLKEHQETHFTTMVNCDICGRALSNKRTLKRHLRTHTAINEVRTETTME